MLYEKTNENNSLLEELKSFCLALILVTTLFYIGLNSFHFDHSEDLYHTTDQFNKETESIATELFIPVFEICKDLIVDKTSDKKVQLLRTINTQARPSKSISVLKRKMKIKDPVISTPPTGLSSSFKDRKKPVKKIKTPVTTIKQEPVLGVSKPYILNKSLSKYKNIIDFNKYNNLHTNSCKIKNNILRVLKRIDHIPTYQTNKLLAFNDIELNKSHLRIINSGIEYLIIKNEESNLGLRK